MRDVERMKEKMELSLDSRQIGGLVVAGIVVVGTVFVLGVVVGKNLAVDERAQSAPDLLTALDQRAEELQRVQQADAALTFQDELTRQGPTQMAVPEPLAPPVAQAPAVAPEPAPAAEMAAVAPKAEPAVPTRTAPKPLQDAISRAQRPSGVTEEGAFTLQLSATQSRDEADRFAARLRDRGYAPYIVEAEVTGRGTWFRVRMGSFPNKEAASRYLLDFRRETQLEAFVASTN